MSYPNIYIRYFLCSKFSCLMFLLLLAPLALASDKDRPECVSGQTGPLATIALLSKKNSVSDADFYAYWRDIHGMLATRIPGFWTYRQYHLGEELVGFRRLPIGYSKAIESLQGFADVSFCNEQAMGALAASPQSELIKHDEQNVFASSYLYVPAVGDSLTLKRQQPLTDLTGDNIGNTLIMLLAKFPNEQFNDFRADMDATLQALSTSCPTLQRLRVNYFQTYDATAWPAPEVNHQPNQIFNAAIEFQFIDGKAATLDCLIEHPVFGESKGLEKRRFQQAYSVKQRYAMVVDGRISLIGLRGQPAIELISRVGAKNQISDEVLKVVYGDFVR